MPVLLLAALIALPATASSTNLPEAGDPCVALTPAVVDQLRAGGALAGLVPDGTPTSTVIAAGRALTGCPPVPDPDPATVRARVCPLLTSEGVRGLADRFGATRAVGADLGPERVAVGRRALRCDSPAAATPAATTAGGEGAVAGGTSAGSGPGNPVDRADRGVLQEPLAITTVLAVAAMIGVLLLAVRRRGRLAGRRELPGRTTGESGAGRPSTAAATEHGGDPPQGDAGARGRPENRPETYDDLLEGLRREVTELQRADGASRRSAARPDDQPDR